MLGRAVAALLGLLMAATGALWTFQGLGYVEGSPMTGSTAWAIIGPVLAGLGVALLIVAARGRRL